MFMASGEGHTEFPSTTCQDSVGADKMSLFAFKEPIDTSIMGQLGASHFMEIPVPIVAERRRRRRGRGRRSKSRSGCFTNPRTGVRMRRVGRGFKRC